MNPNKVNFVQRCGELLRIAKPHLVSCELMLGKDIPLKPCAHGYASEEEYVVVTCDNGYSYKICVEANSLAAIAGAIFSSMAHK